jgi:hypothetical protein
MFIEEISVKKLKEQIDVISDFNVLNKLLAKEQRKTGREIIKDRINRLRIEKDGLIKLPIFDRLVNKIPYGNRDYVRTTIPKEIQDAIFKRDDNTCQLCKGVIKESIVCHHIIPSGKAVEENLITLCSFCHDVIHMFLGRKGYKSQNKYRGYY